jgi:hypothetical protein
VRAADPALAAAYAALEQLLPRPLGDYEAIDVLNEALEHVLAPQQMASPPPRS